VSLDAAWSQSFTAFKDAPTGSVRIPKSLKSINLSHSSMCFNIFRIEDDNGLEVIELSDHFKWRRDGVSEDLESNKVRFPHLKTLTKEVDRVGLHSFMWQ